MCSKRLSLMVAACSSVTVLCGCQQADRATFGAPFSARSSVGVSDAVTRATEGKSEPVVVKGRINQVCQKRGCWMTLSEGDREILVRFTASAQCADGYFVPRNAMGHEAWVHGAVHKKMMSEDEARHYAEDEGKSADEIDKIVGPQPVFSLIATGVTIGEATGLEDPPQ